MKVFHVISGLGDGGAEAVLYRLVQSTPEYNHNVISLSGQGKYGSLLSAAGIPVTDLAMTSSIRSVIPAVYRLNLVLRRRRPHVVQTWMYHADLVGGLAARLAGINSIFWTLHHASVEAEYNPLSRLRVIRTNAWLSKILPTRIISCSRAGLEKHRSIGYASDKLIFIPNGHLVNQFRPDAKAREAVRGEFGMDASTLLLGMVARLDEHKDHLNLLGALELLRDHIEFKCLLVGRGLEQNSPLSDDIKARNLGQTVILVGPRSDIPEVMNALDIHVLSSIGEAFPNVLCEAMLCGTLCVTTDVGDSAFIVGQTGWVVPPRSPDKLAAALQMAAKSCRDAKLKAAARRRIVENFSMDRMRDAYIGLWSDHVDGCTYTRSCGTGLSRDRDEAALL